MHFPTQLNDVWPQIFKYCQNDFETIIAFSRVNIALSKIAKPFLEETKQFFEKIIILQDSFGYEKTESPLMNLCNKSNRMNGIGGKFQLNYTYIPIVLKNKCHISIDNKTFDIKKVIELDKAEDYEYDFTLRVKFDEKTDAIASLEINTVKNDAPEAKIIYLKHAVDFINNKIKPKELNISI